MSQILPSAAKLLLANTLVKSVSPAISTINYSTKQEATFQIKPFKLHKLESGPATTATLNSEDAIKLYEQLAMLRRIETAAGNLYKEKIIRGFCHLYSGQEAVAVGMHAAMRNMDSVITAYRCHGWTYLMGVSTVGVLAELTGRSSGCSKGKGGSMHLYGKNFYGGNGIVGAQIQETVCLLDPTKSLFRMLVQDIGIRFPRLTAACGGFLKMQKGRHFEMLEHVRKLYFKNNKKRMT